MLQRCRAGAPGSSLWTVEEFERAEAVVKAVWSAIVGFKISLRQRVCAHTDFCSSQRCASATRGQKCMFQAIISTFSDPPYRGYRSQTTAHRELAGAQ
eukprot:5145205-Prymnesium_polylepis.1